MAIFSDTQIRAIVANAGNNLQNLIPPTGGESSNTAQLQAELDFWTRVAALAIDGNTTAIANAKVTACTVQAATHGITQTEGGVQHFSGTSTSVNF